MPIIYLTPNLWIESHRVFQAAVPIGGFLIQIVNLDKPGRFVGMGAVKSFVGVDNFQRPPQIDANIAEFIYGLSINQVRVSILNETTVQDIALQFVIYLKK